MLRVAASTWELMAEDSPLRQYVRGGVTPNDVTAQLYRNAKIGLNLHRTSEYYVPDSQPAANGAESMNPRCYELAAADLKEKLELEDGTGLAADVIEEVIAEYPGNYYRSAKVMEAAS